MPGIICIWLPLHDVHSSGLYSTIINPLHIHPKLAFLLPLNILISSRLLAVIIKIGTLSRKKINKLTQPKRTQIGIYFKPKDWYTVYMIPLAQNSIIVAMPTITRRHIWCLYENELHSSPSCAQNVAHPVSHSPCRQSRPWPHSAQCDSRGSHCSGLNTHLYLFVNVVCVWCACVYANRKNPVFL